MPPEFIIGSMLRHVSTGYEAIIVSDLFNRDTLKGWVWAMFRDGSYAMITRHNSDNWDMID